VNEIQKPIDMNSEYVDVGILKKCVEAAVKKFTEMDNELLCSKLDLHEQAYSHRIAVYLERIVQQELKPVLCERVMGYLRVDCEYNKHLDDGKKLDGVISYFGEFQAKYAKGAQRCCPCNVCKEMRKTPPVASSKEGDERQFRPDVVVHRRGCDCYNLIAIEVKKSVVCPFDLAKLKALTLNHRDGFTYGYRLGAFLYFESDKPKHLWLTNGILEDCRCP
jgi:hypothetical protein